MKIKQLLCLMALFTASAIAMESDQVNVGLPATPEAAMAPPSVGRQNLYNRLGLTVHQSPTGYHIYDTEIESVLHKILANMGDYASSDISFAIHMANQVANIMRQSNQQEIASRFEQLSQEIKQKRAEFYQKEEAKDK